MTLDKTIEEIERELVESPTINTNAKPTQYGTCMAISTKNPDQKMNQLQYMGTMIKIKRYTEKLTQEGYSIPETVHHITETFNNRKDIIQVFKSYFEANILYLIKINAIQPKEAENCSFELEKAVN